MKTLPSERGQAMVLIALSIVALLGVAALAVDLGQVYAARRNAQNAADAAALAAAYDASAESMDPALARDKAFSIALINGFDNNGETNWVQVNNPPVDGPYCKDCPESTTEYADEYYQVLVTARLKPLFAQYVFKGLEEVTVEAIAHGNTADDMTAGNALMALSEDEDAFLLDGTVKVKVNGGNMRSNGSITRNGKGPKSYINVVVPGKILYNPKYTPKETVKTFTGALPETAAPARIASITPPACPDLEKNPSAVDTWEDGGSFKYKVTNGVTTYYYDKGLSVFDLPAGIHCIDGGIDKGNYTGTDILLVLLSGDVKQTGGDSFNFRAATDMKDAKGTQWGGMVFYAPPENKNVIKFGGNSGGYFYGVVYAPGATCDVGGTEDGQAIHSAVICNKIKFHGTPEFNVEYVPEELYHLPPLVELVQ